LIYPRTPPAKSIIPEIFQIAAFAQPTRITGICGAAMSQAVLAMAASVGKGFETTQQNGHRSAASAGCSGRESDKSQASSQKKDRNRRFLTSSPGFFAVD
jgi:hypothetical protein